MKKELGDVLWYLTALAEDFALTLEDIAYTNVNKLESRAQRGVISGSGDNR
jgi:NTP pyrophosphatase (non-canonical NTP hydrolase)